MQITVERRPTLWLIIVLAALFVLMSLSDETRGVRGTRTLFERTVMALFSPIPRAVNEVGQSASDIYHGYIDMRDQIAENRELKRKVEELTRENISLRSASDDLARMREMLGYSVTSDIPAQLADIMMIDVSGYYKSMIIDRGSENDVEINDAVVTPSGLVGRVILTTPELSKVQLITDPKSAVGCVVERTRRHGVLRGDGRGGLVLENIPALADVVPGDRIVTAGIDGIYPEGILAAVVTDTEEASDLFRRVNCEPAAAFEKLEDVLILDTPKLPGEVVRYEP
ncbi:MAG: rod shape-determining protein MreC [Thermoanaerobaculia bacterium]|nr:rod shape-determining protein MreC [Thermoanaerobaculia bacterium]